MADAVVGRHAPTPSGHLHLGNALAFGAAWLSVRGQGGRLLLRIEDLDRGRSRPEIAESQRADLQWLGLSWDAETAPQSTREYPLDGLPVYLCDCSRKQRLGGACACRAQPAAEGTWRFRCPPGSVSFVDRVWGPQQYSPGSDPIVRRRNGEAAYPLAVVLDDARDGVTEVVRGADLLEATAVQVRLAEALGLPRPTYLHVPMLLGADGRKLSKSHGSTELRALRRAGWTADDVWATLLPLLGLHVDSLSAAVSAFDPARVPQRSFTMDAAGRVVAGG
ncbi:MAG: tRNA glutamyl-Q(34) synthetase GluQRS [Deltaproteobacteria bacterium]|nr:tRNA glutamyl-Q(34) synthetase GluQRS [Deltaproteobacteria bacterium]HCH64975.1 tRNA glutamyl-Q(34) synthetase GluQRS [Deltaproteobacteria bacterium]